MDMQGLPVLPLTTLGTHGIERLLLPVEFSAYGTLGVEAHHCKCTGPGQGEWAYKARRHIRFAGTRAYISLDE